MWPNPLPFATRLHQRAKRLPESYAPETRELAPVSRSVAYRVILPDCNTGLNAALMFFMNWVDTLIQTIKFGVIFLNNINRFNKILSAKLMFSVAALFLFVAPAQAQMACRINLEVTKGGFVIGASGGSGTLTCDGKRYPLSVGGLRVGLTIGLSRVNLVGEVRNLRKISDIAGTYSGVGASAALGGGANNVVASNQNGVQLVMRGRQKGIEASLDLGGMTIRLK